MNKIYYLVVFLLVYNLTSADAQHIKDETIEYSYTKLPSTPLSHTIKNYQSSITASYEAENDQKKAEYEAKLKQAQADYEQDKAEYPAKVKAAEDSYKSDMEDWNKKSTGKKIMEKEVLGENNKPVKRIPSPPSLAYVQKPDLKSSYDYSVLASTYIHLEGFEKNPENSIKVIVTLYGYEYTQPHQLTEQKDMTHYANGKSQSYKATYYHTEFSYRHPMAIKVIAPDGKEVMNVSPQELNTYTIYKSAETESAAPVDAQMLIKTYEEKILQANLTILNNLLNDKLGYQPTKRKVDLNYVKDKDEAYKDLMIAFNDASAGLKILISDPGNAKTKLQSALQTWNTALQESDPKNKHARIDKDVTIAICFNMLEGYFAVGNVTGADKIITQLNSMDISNRERRRKEEYEALFNDFKKRVQSNN